MDPTKFSRNYKIGSIEGNMLFDGSSYLPKEVVLDIALNAFGFDVDMIEVYIHSYTSVSNVCIFEKSLICTCICLT